MKFGNVKVGDTVNRLLAGNTPMKLRVTAVDDTYIYCSPPGVTWDKEDGWKFLRLNGVEVDEDLGWGVIKDGAYYTGSFLVLGEQKPLDAAPRQ